MSFSFTPLAKSHKGSPPKQHYLIFFQFLPKLQAMSFFSLLKKGKENGGAPNHGGILGRDAEIRVHNIVYVKVARHQFRG